MSSRRKLGLWGENLAAKYLDQIGYQIIDRNVYTGFGEIDLVALYKECMIFVEVKTRSSTAYGFPEEAITEKKKIHLIESAEAYLQLHPEFSGDWRIDVIAIQRYQKDQEPEIVHYENAFT